MQRTAPGGGPFRAGTRVTALVGALIAALCLVVVGVGAGAATAAGGTHLRVAHLDPAMAAGELVVSSVTDPGRQTTFPPPAYGGITEYRPIEPGSYVVSVRAAGTGGPPLITSSLDVRAGSAHTLATVGAGEGRQGLAVLVDDLSAPPPGQGRLRVINAVPGPPAVDIGGSGPGAQRVARGGASEYRTVPAGMTALAVGAPDVPSAELPVVVQANQVVSVVLVERGDGVAATLAIDASGPVAVPPGPMHAGSGGAADQEPGGRAGVPAFLALTVAAGALSVHLARRAAHRRAGSPRVEPG